MEELKAPVVCGECKYWTEDSGKPNHALYCSEYKKYQIEKTSKAKKPLVEKLKHMESIEENYPVAGHIWGILKIIGLILFLIILFAFMWGGMEFAY